MLNVENEKTIKLENSKIIFSGTFIAKNTAYNLLGYGIPIAVALIFIPLLIKGLGEERFGILTLAWIVIGYFSFLDFGIGKSLTKVIAESIGLNQTEKIPTIFWSSLLLMLAISILISIGLVLIIPSLVNKFLKISLGLRSETLKTFYALAVSIPIVSTMAGLRGVLEAYQKFGVINLMRVFLGIFTFIGPLLCLIVTNSLFWIVVLLIFIRIVIWLLYLFQCFKINKKIKNGFDFNFNLLKPVLKFSAWITAANIIGPIILYSDRFLIGSIVSAKAITYYATPYEIVTKLLLFPSALIGVLFPIFSARFFIDPDSAKNILLRGIKFVFLILYPAVLLIVTFSYQGMQLWLGEKFAFNSSFILRLLAIGILMNSVSLIPNNFFQGIGKPKIPTIVNLIELPFYILIMWFMIKNYGIKGAAFAYMVAAIMDTIIMFTIASKKFSIKFISRFNTFSILSMIFGLTFPFCVTNLFVKTAFVCIFLSMFLILTWKYLLSKQEKIFLISKLKLKRKL
jgi:O-antigen/teichoic acid export membrane protein